MLKDRDFCYPGYLLKTKEKAKNSEKSAENKSSITEADELKEIRIEGIMCEHCEARIKAALEAVAGVAGADVSHKTGTAKVTLLSQVQDEALRTAVENAGYKVIEIR